MRLRILFTIGLLSCFLVSLSQEHVAGIKGTQEWKYSDVGTVPGYAVMIRNTTDGSLGVEVIAQKDSHFEIEESPLGVYLSDSGTVLVADSITPSLCVGGKIYNGVHYTKHKARMNGAFANIEMWQLEDNGVEYSIIAIGPVKKNRMIKEFIARNLTLLPLPEVSEESFIQSVESLNALMQKMGGSKMSDELKMTSVVADRNKREFIRTYQFYPGVSEEEIDLITSNDATYLTVIYEQDSTPLVKSAVELGYSIVVVWNDANGELISSYKYDL